MRQSQTTKFTGARFDRLIHPIWSTAPQMDSGHKPLFLSVDASIFISPHFHAAYMQVPFEIVSEHNLELNSQLNGNGFSGPWPLSQNNGRDRCRRQVCVT